MGNAFPYGDANNFENTSGKCLHNSNQRSSYKERKGDALASGADEGRDKLRKAAGSGTYAMIRRYPNGETRQGYTLSAYGE